MYTKNYLKENQPIVFRTIKNAFKYNRAVHAYIIDGPKGSPILKAAIFFAQSFVCLNKDSDGLACESCLHCQRIENQSYADFKILDGEKLKKDDLLALQENFNKEAIESGNIKIYIINLIEKVSAKLLNMLLKFIEEPSSNIIAIFTSNQTSKILPTIISRCEVISFKALSFQESYNEMLKNDISHLDAWLISKISNDPNENLKIVNDENYQKAKELLENTLSYLKDVSDHLLVYFEKDNAEILDNKDANKEKNKKIIDYYLDMLATCLFEAIRLKHDEKYEIPVYKEELTIIAKRYDKLDKSLEEISLMQINMQTINANKSLAFARLFINLLKEAQNGRSY